MKSVPNSRKSRLNSTPVGDILRREGLAHCRKTNRPPEVAERENLNPRNPLWRLRWSLDCFVSRSNAGSVYARLREAGDFHCDRCSVGSQVPAASCSSLGVTCRDLVGLK